MNKNTVNRARDKILIGMNLLMFLMYAGEASANAYNWGKLSSGTNATVYAITFYQGSIVVGGQFTQAGGINVNHIATWSAANGWDSLGGGLNNDVYSLIVFNGELYAAGRFVVSGFRGIAKWTGATWQPVGTGFNDDVNALEVYNSLLYAGGHFTFASGNPANHIAFWDGATWQPVSSGVNDIVNTLRVFDPGTGNKLYVGGSFDTAGGQQANNIASWDISLWLPLGSGSNNGVNDTVQALTVYGSSLIVGGNFTTAGVNAANYIASWNGANWNAPFGAGMNDAVFSLVSYNGDLIAGGIFKYANNHYVDRVAKWNGTDWSRLITGTNNRINALFVRDTSLYAGGSFTTAGGKYISRIAKWSNELTSTISGTVTYSDSNNVVTSGKVKALRLDVNTREIIVVDSTDITNGNYILTRVLRDTLTYILCFPEDVLARALVNFVPTYYPSAINWQNAVTVYPINNLTNIDVSVFRITPGPENPTHIQLPADCGGHVYLRFTPPQNGRDMDVGLPYKSGSIVYAKQGNAYKGFGVSNTLEEYNVPQLAAGTYEMYAYRLGYTNAMRIVPLGNVSIDTIDFYLDSVSLIGIHTISTEVPKEFVLYQNYPNPFNPVTMIKFEVPSNVKRETSNVKMVVYDILGREIIALVNEELKPGTYEVTWNAGNLASGLYFYKMTAGELTQSKKMVLIK